tara:strand:+ start:23780 stop:24238 length:459 start_codon:yes stop_codon:yes gene_type:complete
LLGRRESFYKSLLGLGLVAILASCKGVSQEEFETVSLDLTETQVRLLRSESVLSDVESDLDKLRTQVDTVLPVIKLVDMFMEIRNNPPTDDKEADVMFELLNLIDVIVNSNDEQISDSGQILKRGLTDDSVSGDAAATVLFSMLGRAANILE